MTWIGTRRRASRRDRAARSLWLASDEVNQAEFVARADGEPSFDIRPPGRRAVYYVTLFSYPRVPSGTLLGADARANPGVLATLEEARDSGKTTVSNQTTLPGDEDLPAAERPVAYELFVPVYRQEDPGASVAQRRRLFVGWATGQFRAGDLLTEALRDSPPATGVELHDILTERAIPVPLVLGMGVAVSVLLGALLWVLAQVGALYREVGRLARTDALTGVPNRRAWDDELPMELARAARSGQPLCAALLDLDHFKAYNDRHGHQAGDRLLKAAASAWQGRLRKTDVVARYGGEEFAVLLPDCGLGNAMEIAERLRTAQPEGTCSIGVAAWDGRESAAELVARADQALYAAKAAGRDRCLAAPAATEPAAGAPAR